MGVGPLVESVNALEDQETVSNKSQVEQVLWYRRQGWWVIDTAVRSKIPNASPEGWQNQRLTEDQLVTHFSSLQNVSLLLGIDPIILIDVDLDTPEAVRAAYRKMPATGAMFGRRGRGLSHYLYQVDHTPKTLAWKVGGRKIIELRSRGHQTVIPNSVHTSGADILWMDPNTRKIQFGFDARPGPPSRVEPDELIQTINYIAAVSAVAEIWTQGTRHDAAFCLAGGLARSGMDRELAVQFIQDICEVAGDEDETNNHERSLAVHDTYNKWEAGDRQLRGWPSLEELISGNGRAVTTAIREWLGISAVSRLADSIPTMNDQGNADRYVDLYQSDLRYNVDTGEWLAWEGTRWRAGRTHTALHYAKAIPELIKRDALDQSDPKVINDMLRFANESGNANRVANMVRIAQTRPEMIVEAADLDTDPADVNFINYTFNLETMAYRPHRPEDRITKLCPVKYDPRAPMDKRWQQFLKEVTQGDEEFEEYLQIASGLTMSGFTDEEALFIAHGPAATGKTTFLETLRAVLGDYAAAASPETFLAGGKSNGGAARPDLIKLMGKRFVTAVEIDEGRHLAHAVVKSMTGNDTIAARQLYQHEIEFKPVCKIWMATNHDPGIRANDTGMWRRVHVLNFHNVVPPERQDKTLKAHLRDMNEVGPALVNWMIEGYRKYKAIGLHKPEVVERAIKDYRDTQDFMFDFFAANCIFDKNAQTMGNDLMQRYKEWAHSTGNPDLATNVLANRFKEAGLRNVRTNKGKRWEGIRLRSRAEISIGLVSLDEEVA